MAIEIIEAGEDLKPVVLNLGNFYIYDFSEYMGFGCQEDGQFYTGHWEKYWSEPSLYPYLVKVDGEVAGFVLVGPVGSQPETQYDFNEFFVMRKFRKQGVGQVVAHRLFDRFRGQWEVRVMVENTAAQPFWRKVISRYTNGDYRELPEPVVVDGYRDIVLTFDSRVRCV